MSSLWNRGSDEESGVLDKKDAHDVQSVNYDSEGPKSGVDAGVGEVNRALKHRHLQMIGIGGGKH